jgi:(p)ppGpp synthase/HD superfamily hydrolase
MKRITKIKEATYLAISLHGMQTYDGKPYFYHLEQVVDVLKEFGFTEDKYVIAGYLHDTLEDTSISYNDIKKQFGEEVAEIVFAVTDELGRNRRERKEKTYPKIKANPDAIIIKLADRIANMSNAIKEGNAIVSMYKKEYPAFKKELYMYGEAEEMWSYLDKISVL